MNITDDRSHTYDAFPSVLIDSDRKVWIAWVSLQDRRDLTCVRSFDPDAAEADAGRRSPVRVLGDSRADSFWPRLVWHRDGRVRAVWCSHSNGRWSLWVAGVSPPAEPERIALDAWQPVAAVDGADTLCIAWVDVRTGRVCVMREGGPVEVLSPGGCQRPALDSGLGLTVAWDQSEAGAYDVWARHWRGADGWGPPAKISRGPEWETLPQLGSDLEGHLYCCWVSAADVRDDKGVIDQWPSIRCARAERFNPNRWEPSGEDDFGTAARLCHGLLAKESIWGYNGRRRHPFIRLDFEGEPWLLWESKVDPDGPVSAGRLVGARLRSARPLQPVELASGYVFYEMARNLSTEEGLWTAMRMPEGRDAWDIHLDQIRLTDAGAEVDTSVDDWSRWERISLPGDVAPSPPRPSIANGERELRLYFGDVHAHTGLSADAEGEPDELLHYARDKAELDFVALIDNDCYQCPLTASQFRTSLQLTDRFNRDGEFVTLPGYEWTLWDRPNCPHPDHRSVLFPGDADIFRHTDPDEPTTGRMARRVADLGGLLFTQHWDWSLTDSAAEAGLEVCSAWAYYIDKPEPFFRDLSTGRRLAFVGGSDSHRRNPGTCGALTGVYAYALTREAIFEALRARRCYATSGSRMALDVRVNGAPMGSDITGEDSPTISVLARGTRPLKRVAVWRGPVGAGPPDVREVFATGVAGGEAAVEWTDADMPDGECFYYIVVEQEGEDIELPSNLATAEGSRAWSSPVWVRRE